jgi:hypothetical protein
MHVMGGGDTGKDGSKKAIRDLSNGIIHVY